MALFCVCFGLANDMMTPIKVNIFSVISQVCVPIVILAYMVNVFSCGYSDGAPICSTFLECLIIEINYWLIITL